MARLGEPVVSAGFNISAESSTDAQVEINELREQLAAITAQLTPTVGTKVAKGKEPQLPSLEVPSGATKE